MAPDFHQITQMVDAAFKCLVALAARLLITPVGGDAIFGVLVHLVRANLDFERLAFFEDHRRMQRLIEVILWCSDVIIELARDWTPCLMNYPQHLIAGVNIIDQNADGTNIVNLLERDAFALHLAPDAVDMLGTPADLRIDPMVRQKAAQLLKNLVHVEFAVRAALIDETRNHLVAIRLQIAEGEVFKLP